MKKLLKITTALTMIRHWTNPQFWIHLSAAFTIDRGSISAATWIKMKLKIDTLPNEAQT